MPRRLPFRFRDDCSFDFLGFTHVWGRLLQGKDIIRRITAKGRFARALKSVHQWCRRCRHLLVKAQRDHLARLIRGHCAYYGLTGNGKRLEWFGPLGRPHLAEVALTPQPRPALKLGPDEGTRQEVCSAVHHNRAPMATFTERNLSGVRWSRTLGSVGGGAR